MAYPEIDSFVSKFKFLWNLGIAANLKVGASNGKAKVVLVRAKTSAIFENHINSELI